MKIAVLGPMGTYCDVALTKYMKDKKLDFEKRYYPSILKTANAVDLDTMAILPFENTLDGFVMETIDRIISRRLTVIDQVKLSIDFAFVTNADKVSDVKCCYCQFKAYGQCLEFISDSDFTVIKTDSNTQSRDMLEGASDSYGAIIPVHLVEEGRWKTVIYHVADSKNNETRFFILKANGKPEVKNNILNASLVVFSDEDRPGLLYEILKEFHEDSINLNSILSRPSKEYLGRYNFYMECSLRKNEVDKLNQTVAKLTDLGFSVRILGIYNAL